MKQSKQSSSTETSASGATVTRKPVHERTTGPTTINDRSAREVSKSDCEQARRELVGDLDFDADEDAPEPPTESTSWDPVPGSDGHKMHTNSSADEDYEGRSANERLVEKGIAGAEQDQMLQANRDAAREDS